MSQWDKDMAYGARFAAQCRLERECDQLKAECERLTRENGRLWNHQTRTEAGRVEYVEADGENIYTIDDGVPLTRTIDGEIRPV